MIEADEQELLDFRVAIRGSCGVVGVCDVAPMRLRHGLGGQYSKGDRGSTAEVANPDILQPTMLIESVPNVSEGRRPEVVAALAEAVRAVPGVRLLDHSSDPSHNRSVFTLVGDAAGVERGVLALFERATAEIDLRVHKGEHPRLGAVDVVPFIPIEGATMADCVALAKEVGQAVAERFGIPVCLYEEAATAPHRRNLEDIRRGQFEGLAEKMRDPQWSPDFGPSAPRPSAGASVIGARMPLIAYNVNLGTGDL